jgi:hypothetical protein
MTTRLALLLSLSCGVAWASGSSTVNVSSTYFVAKLESVRKIFAHDPRHPSTEQDWHKNWVKEAQPMLDKIKLALEKKQETFLKGKGWALVKYAAGARPCESPDETRCLVNLTVDANVGGLTVSVVTEKPLGDEARKTLNAILDRIATAALKTE